jgi:hypothetical protein
VKSNRNIELSLHSSILNACPLISPFLITHDPFILDMMKSLGFRPALLSDFVTLTLILFGGGEDDEHPILTIRPKTELFYADKSWLYQNF